MMNNAATNRRNRAVGDGDLIPKAAGGAPDCLPAYAAFLHANHQTYESLVKKAQLLDCRSHAEAALEQVSFAAMFAAKFHSGRFADGAIENLALDIGVRLHEEVPANDSTVSGDHGDGHRRILHVASSVQGVGGHTRTLHYWVQNDQSSRHSLVLLNQADSPIPEWLAQAVGESGGDLVVIPKGLGLCEKAMRLRQVAGRSADLVVLHHDGCDVVPTVAFAKREGPPVAVLNHADHLFWLGSSVSDLVINLRTEGAEHTAERRFVTSNIVLPIPLEDPAAEVSRSDARRMLGIGEDQIVLLSIGRGIKYRPCGSYDFVSTARKILEREPRAHLYVVGESRRGIAPHLRTALHERLHFVGTIERPSLYRAAADVYLESFPFGSTTALLEAALRGLPVVPAYAPLFPLLVGKDDALQDVLPNPPNETEYVNQVDVLMHQPKQRLERGNALRERLLIDHVGAGWLRRLATLYGKTDQLTHDPRPIPTALCSTSNSDISLSLWNVMSDGKTNAPVTPTDATGAVLRHKAFVAKVVGDYATARRFAWRAVLRDVSHRASWRLLAVTALGKQGGFTRLVLGLATKSVLKTRTYWRGIALPNHSAPNRARSGG
jgi:glycosyltransferase involved in cell wall biosynthesis